ncbi:hypothetical protein LY76DRAFT_433878 [Colletotrichum caudatum]|nr:hypothetical protein LY76DRAFT_433878 [Colletotrichum caudatum]
MPLLLLLYLIWLIWKWYSTTFHRAFPFLSQPQKLLCACQKGTSKKKSSLTGRMVSSYPPITHNVQPLQRALFSHNQCLAPCRILL